MCYYKAEGDDFKDRRTQAKILSKYLINSYSCYSDPLTGAGLGGFIRVELFGGGRRRLV